MPYKIGKVDAGPPAKNGQVDQAVGSQAVGPMDRDASAFAGGIKAVIRIAVSITPDPAVHVRGYPAHDIAEGRPNTPLGCPRMASDRMNFRKYGRIIYT